MNITARVTRRLLPVLAVIGLVLGSAASPAQAVADDPIALFDAPHVQFAGPVWAPAPVNLASGLGNVHWDTSAGTIRPHLTGTLHIFDAMGLPVRMQIGYYDVNDNRLATETGGTVTAEDWDHHAWSVDLQPYANPNIHYIIVSTTWDLDCGNWQFLTRSPHIFL